MCGCNSDGWFKEQYFGRQVRDSGSLDWYIGLGSELGKAVYFPTNPLPFDPELGFVGAKYALGYVPVPAEYLQAGYGGVLPVDQQPVLDFPQPYEREVVW